MRKFFYSRECGYRAGDRRFDCLCFVPRFRVDATTTSIRPPTPYHVCATHTLSLSFLQNNHRANKGQRERLMESFSTFPRQHRGHDGSSSAGRRGTFKNKTWVAGDRSGSSTPLPGADALRWERGGPRGGLARGGRGRGRGRSPRPDAEPSQQQQHPAEDFSEQEDDAVMNGAADANGAEAAAAAVAADEPVLETLEERERFYQEVSQPFAHTLSPWAGSGKAIVPFLRHFFLSSS